MANPSDLKALRNLIEQAQLIVSSNPIPPGGRERADELLRSALALSEGLLESNRTKPAAAILGKRGGQRTAERGPEYFAKIAAMRKTRSGGRPKNTP